MKPKYFPEEYQRIVNDFHYSSKDYLIGSYDIDFKYQEPNMIELQCPEQVIFSRNQKGDLWVYRLPVCTQDSISNKRYLEYPHKKMTFYAKRKGGIRWHEGSIEFDPGLGNIVRPVIRGVVSTDIETTVERHFSFNLFNFIHFIKTTGRYEVYCSRCGVKSNHCFIDIIVNIETPQHLNK